MKNNSSPILIFILVAVTLLFIKFLLFDKSIKKIEKTKEETNRPIITIDTIIKNGYVKNYISKTNQLIAEGKMVKGLRDSIWLYYNVQGQITEKVNFINDKRNGLSLTFYPNNNIYEKYNYFNNVLNGKYEKYYEDGKILMERGEYTLGRLTGVLETFTDDGLIEERDHYTNGFKNGTYEAYGTTDGHHILKTVGFYKSDLKDSLWKNYNLYFDFKIKKFTNKIILLSTENYKNDELNGTSTTYDQIYGFKLDETTYVNGIANGFSKSYCPTGYDRGKLYIIEEYKDGKIVQKLPYQCKCKSDNFR